MEVLILTGDRDSIQLVTDRSTVLYPMRGVSDLARMTPKFVEDKYGVPPERYPELAAIVGETSDNLPGVPGVGQGYAAKWLNTYDGLDNVIAHADEITGKKGEALREHLGDVIRNRRLNALVTDLDLGVRPSELALQPWDRQAALDALRRARVPRRAPHPHHRDARRRGADRGRRLRAGRPHPRRRRGRCVPRRARRPGGRPPRPRQLGGRHRSDRRPRVRRGRRAGGVRRRGRPRPGRRGGAGRLAGRPDPAEGPPRRQGPGARARRARVGARRRRERHRPDGVPRPSRPALLRPRRPDPALPAARAQGRGRQRPGRPLRRWRRRRRRLDGDALRPRGDRPVDRARGRARAGRGIAAADRGRAAARAPAGPDGADRHRGRPRPPDVARGALRRRGAQRGRRGVRRDRQGDQPRLAEAAAGRALRRARHAEDQAHQDRLHDRRRRAAGALRQDRAPVPAAPAAAPRREPAPPDHRGPAQDGAARRPDPHDVQPDDRRDRAAVEHRSQPPEHPRPHRGGPPDPRGLRGRRPASSR